MDTSVLDNVAERPSTTAKPSAAHKYGPEELAMAKIVGNNIALIRRREGMSKDELGKAAGYAGDNSINNIEAGRVFPSTSKLARIARKLNVDLAALFQKKMGEVDYNHFIINVQGKPHSFSTRDKAGAFLDTLSRKDLHKAHAFGAVSLPIHRRPVVG